MRILFVHEKFGAFGGAEANILATATELQARGHLVAILHGPRTGKGESEWASAFPIGFPMGTGAGSNPALAACNRFRPEVIYIHKLSDLETVGQLLEWNTPIIRMVHDHDLYCMRSYKYNYATRRICERAMSPYCLIPCGAFLARDRDGALPIKWVSYTAKRRELDLNRKFHRLVVATRFMQDELLRNGFDPEKIEIHSPVPRDGAITWQSSFSDQNYIVYAGQIVRGKGVDVLLQSLARVRTPFKCVIFGEGAHRAFCEDLRDNLGLSDRVVFKGYVPPEQISSAYLEASVAVVSSVWPEPFGAVGLEAMRFGLPVVAFDAGGIREWLANGQNGFLVPWMDRVAFAARVDELLGNKTLARRMGDCGRQLVASKYGFSEYITGLETMFTQTARAQGIEAVA
jgi:glycosyltransferase involved in cell wall biosynthesis